MTEPSTKIAGLLQAWNAGAAAALERRGAPLPDLVALELRDGRRAPR